MTTPTLREVEHAITVHAPAREVYRLLAEVGNWPRLFPPTIHVDYLERGSGHERIRIWATANGEAKSWTSRRELDPGALVIKFWQEASAPPVAEMNGTWVITPEGEGQTRLRLLHAYRAIGDDPGDLAWIDRAVDTNSRSELPALKAALEQATSSLTLSFADTVTIAGQAADAYDFIAQARLWPTRLPHVARVDLTEDTPGLQVLRMDTSATDGSTHTTESVRVCLPHHTIAYKQTTLPALMTLHAGTWLFAPDPARPGVIQATSAHTVVINPDTITAILGPAAGIPEARRYVQAALSANSSATLAHARAYAESRPHATNGAP